MKSEFLIFKEVFNPKNDIKPQIFQDIPVWYFECRKNKCAVTYMGDMGITEMALFSEKMVKKLNPKLVSLIGIAGALTKDLRVGDVIVASQVENWMEKGAVVDGIFGENNTSISLNITLSGETYRPSNQGERQATYFSAQESYKDWFSKCLEFRGVNINPLIQQLDNDKKNVIESLIESFDDIKKNTPIQVGHIISGDFVVKTSMFAKFYQKKDRKVCAAEMEAGGLLKMLYRHDNVWTKSLIIRGISDCADEKKEVLDNISKDGILRGWAMHNASTFMMKMLEINDYSNL